MHRYRPAPHGAYDVERPLLRVGGRPRVRADVRFVCRVVEVPEEYARRWADLAARDDQWLGKEAADARAARRLEAYLQAGGIAVTSLYRGLVFVTEGEGDEPGRFVQPLFGLS